MAAARWRWSVGGGQAPDIPGIADEIAGVALGVVALHFDADLGVAEIVAVARRHRPVADAAEIDPGMREEVDEEGAGIEIALLAEEHPGIARGEGVVARLRD